jgi:hypothetical protein
VSVTIVASESQRVFCALFHDRTDGFDFGKLIASELVNAFSEEYGSDIGLGHNAKDFHGFNFKIADVIRQSVRPVLFQLQQENGVEMAAFVTETNVTHVGSRDTSAEVDQLGRLHSAHTHFLSSLSLSSIPYPLCINASVSPSPIPGTNVPSSWL